MQDNGPAVSESNPSDPSPHGARKTHLIASQIAALLQQHGIKPLKHVSWVADATNMGARTARRKLQGVTAFGEDDLATILDHLGFEYGGLLGLKRKSSPETTETTQNGPFDIQVTLDGIATQAKAWIREDQAPLPGAKGGKVLVHSKDDGAFQLCPIDQVPPGEPYLLVDRIEIRSPWSYESTGEFVLVMDEQEAAGQMMTSALRNAGFKSKAVATIDSLRECLDSESPDAFLVSWASWSRWKPDEIAGVIRTRTNAPITFSAGLDEGADPGLLQAAVTWHADIMPQPVRPAVLFKQLLKRLRTP